MTPSLRAMIACGDRALRDGPGVAARLVAPGMMRVGLAAPSVLSRLAHRGTCKGRLGVSFRNVGVRLRVADDKSLRAHPEAGAFQSGEAARRVETERKPFLRLLFVRFMRFQFHGNDGAPRQTERRESLLPSPDEFRALELAETMTLNPLDEELQTRLEARCSEEVIVKFSGLGAFPKPTSKFNGPVNLAVLRSFPTRKPESRARLHSTFAQPR